MGASQSAAAAPTSWTQNPMGTTNSTTAEVDSDAKRRGTIYDLTRASFWKATPKAGADDSSSSSLKTAAGPSRVKKRGFQKTSFLLPRGDSALSIDAVTKLDPQISALPTLQGSFDPRHSCNVGVLEGSPCSDGIPLFNPSPPTEPALISQLDSFYPGGIHGYSCFIHRLNKTSMKHYERSSKRQDVIREAVMKENIQLPRGMSWDVVLGDAGENVPSNSPNVSTSTLFLVFDPTTFVDASEVLAEAAVRDETLSGQFSKDAFGEELRQLKTLLDAGVITLTDFNTKKAEIMQQWSLYCHNHYVNYSDDLEVVGYVI